jgi:hypothetical protein
VLSERFKTVHGRLAGALLVVERATTLHPHWPPDSLPTHKSQRDVSFLAVRNRKTPGESSPPMSPAPRGARMAMLVFRFLFPSLVTACAAVIAVVDGWVLAAILCGALAAVRPTVLMYGVWRSWRKRGREKAGDPSGG